MTSISYVIMIMKILTVAGSRRGTGVAVVSSIVRPVTSLYSEEPLVRRAIGPKSH